jgi:tRNA (guanine26-N2/guanine27-N2)-dimethyltransferase
VDIFLEYVVEDVYFHHGIWSHETVLTSNYTCLWQELLDVPLYLSLHSLCATLKCTSPPASLFRYAIVNAGYRISGSHASCLGLKTDAPMDVVWDIMRCWVCLHNI